MIQVSTLQFLKDIKKNNKKEWFEINRGRFDTARNDFEKFTKEIIKRLGRIDESIAHLDAKQSTFRQNRDVRFSKDKSPYKVHMGMYLSKGGRKGIQAGYYFHLEPGNSLVAAGLWMPLPNELKKVRQEIDYNLEDLKKILSNKKFRVVYGELEKNPEYTLSRPPKGYEPDNPAIEYLKFKSWIVSAKLSDTDVTSRDLAKKVTGYFATAKPLIDFINQAIEE